MGSAPAARPAGHLYFVNAPVDYLMIGGASLALCVVLWAFGATLRSPLAIVIAANLQWIVNWPHFSATNWRLYHRRENIAMFPVTALVVPVLVCLGAAASFSWPEDVAPYFVKLFLLWSPYHFSGQTVGITMIYARRAGFPVGTRERSALSAFVFGTFILQTARYEVGGNSKFWGVTFPSFGLPPWVGDAALAGLWIAGVAFAVFVARWCLRERRMVPPIVLLPAASQFVWFVLGRNVLSFAEFVPFFHSLQYMLIAWSLQLKERVDLGRAEPSPRFVVSESTRWLAANVVGGGILFYALPRLCGGAGLADAAPPFAAGVVLAAVQIHHFFVDGVIWKLKDPRVSSPLMVNIEEMWRPRSAPVLAAAA